LKWLSEAKLKAQSEAARQKSVTFPARVEIIIKKQLLSPKKGER